MGGAEVDEYVQTIFYKILTESKNNFKSLNYVENSKPDILRKQLLLQQKFYHKGSVEGLLTYL